MRGKSQLRNSILWTISIAVAVGLLVLLAAVPAWTQNPVPPTAREAAASPAFAAKLHPSTPPVTNKPQGAAHVRSGRTLPQGGVVYENGPVNGTTNAWAINFGYIVSDTFVPDETTVAGFDLGVWEFPGDTLSSLQWSITSSPNGGTVYGSGTVSGSSLTDTFISTNQYGYNIDKISATGLTVSVTSGSTYWINLQNAAVPSGDPVYWDENSGKGCQSSGCPSQAVESAIGTIPSEAFDIVGNNYPPPPPCFGSGGALSIIHDFTRQESNGTPEGMTNDKAGNLYGTTLRGGDNHAGLAYELLSKGGGWVLNPLYSFGSGSGGAGPSPAIVGPDGALYGTANNGGYGLVFRLRPAPRACLTSLCSWTENVLYQFSDSGGNIAAFDAAGNLYGFSGSGGTYGKGAIFELTPSPGGWTENVIYQFTGGTDGGGPSSLLVGNDGNLYGTTNYGGAYSYGVVFQLVRSGSGWTENTIYSFTNGNDGAQPQTLAQDSLGNLYGISVGYGFSGGFGGYYAVIFMLSPSSGDWVFSVLYQSPAEPDEYFVGISSLLIDGTGNVYVALGWNNFYEENLDWGAVMMRPPSGAFSNLWYSGLNVKFAPSPGDSLAIDAKGNVYGTTSVCGKNGYGTVWKVSR
jgi:hypothetical protein